MDDSFETMNHKDLIHQFQFDYYGKRMATCSSDMFICVWDRDDKGAWEKTASWKVHGGVVWRVTWAHPSFGQILASCSNDRSVYIWEESDVERRHGNRVERKWSRKAFLADSRTAVTDIKFAPHYLGLMLASCSSQGTVRIYEAADDSDTSQWSLVHEVDALFERASSLSWSLNPALPTLLVVASDHPASAPEDLLRTYQLNDSIRKWKEVLSLRRWLRPSSAACDVRFSPSCAYLGHVLAVAAGDIILYSIKVTMRGEGAADPCEYSAQKLCILAHLNKSWRLSWNIPGTTLAAFSSDGTLRVWKEVFMDEWKLVSTTRPGEREDGIVELVGQAERVAKGHHPSTAAPPTAQRILRSQPYY